MPRVGVASEGQTCPTCGIGKDTDGDGNCPVCESPAYKQQGALDRCPTCGKLDKNDFCGRIAAEPDRTLSMMSYDSLIAMASGLTEVPPPSEKSGIDIWWYVALVCVLLLLLIGSLARGN